MKQLSFLPDTPPQDKRETSHPLVKYIDGRWLWKAIGKDEYLPAPDLEAVLLAAMRKAA